IQACVGHNSSLLLSRKFWLPDSYLHVRAYWPAQLAGMTRGKEAHRILVTLEANGRKIQAAAAQRAFRLRPGTAQFAHRAGVQAGAALAAQLRSLFERTRHAPLYPASGESDGARHHLLVADAHAQPALDAALTIDRQLQ